MGADDSPRVLKLFGVGRCVSEQVWRHRTHAFLFSMDETMDVGCDVGEPVSPDHDARGNGFTGTIKWVQIDIDAAAKDADHLIGAEERFQLAMARQ